MLGKTLPAQVRGLHVAIYRAVLEKWSPGASRSNAARRDASLLRTAPDEVVLRDLPLFGKDIDALLASGDESSVSCPSGSDGSASPLAHVFSTLVQGMREFDPLAIGALRQGCAFLSKLELPPTPASVKQAIADFEQRNELAFDWVLPDTLVAQTAVQLCRRLSCNWDLADISPRHGPGAVASGQRPCEKMVWQAFYESAERFYPAADFYYAGYAHLCDHLTEFLNTPYKESGTNRMVAVPKDFRGPRLIAAEPLELQWLQQGQARAMMREMESSPLVGGNIRFTDQSVNRELALMSSATSDFVTLDLTAASDYVSSRHVTALFPPSVSERLMATRSRFCKTPNGVLELGIYATMGNATTFPVEACVFFIIALSAMLVQDGYKGTSLTRDKISRYANFVHVYGDDIIVRADYAKVVMAALREMGFVPNLRKCCLGPRFRESCGCDAYMGVDVTPFRLRHMPDRHSPASLAGAVDQVNDLRARGMHEVASILRGWVQEELPFELPSSVRRLPFTWQVPYEAEALEWNLSHFKVRRNAALQRLEFLTPVCSPVTCAPEWPAWSSVLRSILMGSTGSDYRCPVPHRTRLTKRWMSY